MQLSELLYMLQLLQFTTVYLLDFSCDEIHELLRPPSPRTTRRLRREMKHILSAKTGGTRGRRRRRPHHRRKRYSVNSIYK